MKRSKLASAACAGAMTAMPALAQTNATAIEQNPVAENAPLQSDELQEIVVTAQKRSENLQRVPVAVTAISASAIKNNRIENITDISALAPNLYVVKQIGSAGLPNTTIRGQSSGAASNVTVDNGISYYIDGVYLGALSGLVFDVADIERIEIIRGPAGTLFGTNSTGGAINYITSGPKGVLSASQELTYARFNTFRTKTRIDLPEWNGLSLGVSYLHNDRGNNVLNFEPRTFDYTRSTGGRVGQVTGVNRLGETKTDAIHAAARYAGLDGLTIDYKFDWARQSESAGGVYLIGFPDGAGAAAAFQIVSSQPLFGGLTLDQYLQTKRGRVAYNDTTSLTKIRTRSHLIVTDYDINDAISLKNTTSWRSLDRNAHTSNLDGTGGLSLPIAFAPNGAPSAFAPFALLTTLCCNNLRQFSNETQANIDTEVVDVTAGLFYYNRYTKRGESPFGATVVTFFTLYPNNEAPGTPPSDFSQNFFFQVRQLAGYGQATLHVTDKLDLVGGLRYTHDDKTIFDTSAGPPGSTTDYKKGNFSYLANVNYRPNDQLLMYIKYVTSFIAGGSSAGPVAIDPVLGSAFQGAAIPYAEETAKSWEAGVKADLFDRRFRANLAVFHVDYGNLQFARFTSVCLTPPSGGPCVTTPSQFTDNTGKARAYGIEAELTAAPVRGLILTANGSYTDFDYTQLDADVLASASVTALGDYREVRRPKVTMNSSAEYTFSLRDKLEATFRLDALFQSRIALTEARSAGTTFSATYNNAYLNDLAVVGSTWTLNARATLAGIQVGRANALISLWGRNITDHQNINFVANTGVTVAGTFEDPATYGVDVTLRF